MSKEIKDHLGCREIDRLVEDMIACNTGDNEADHYDADIVLCKALILLGAKKLVDEYRKIGKWYA